MIEITNLTKKFGEQIALDDINLHFKKGEKSLIIGQNGAGKSTLMKSILGEYLPNTGSVKINGINPLKDRKKALKNIAFVPQTPPPIKLTLSEMVEFVTKSCEISPTKIDEFSKLLEFNLKANLNKPFFKLSGGMKQKFLIAIAYARDCSILMFDEPTANLDPKAREIFKELLANSQGKTAVFISHRLSEMGGLINRVIEMDLAKVVKDEKVV
ncbi:ABC transporter ATP-binding protein [Campylobacter geochelonis]|uniref:ABC transporter ATP-binding protein n=1 Tax=Campylobacter geochelonis TaxID=1780362 RepID=UPI000770B846|nr:ABC transporter ATP-binding protein [Campylobacter geochelonis]CZE49756.1 methionine import ATP-binding protein MetN [Campylobacter geochelonis]